MQPMLCKKIDSVTPYIENEQYAFQPKLDGNGVFVTVIQGSSEYIADTISLNDNYVIFVSEDNEKDTAVLMQIARTGKSCDVNGIPYSRKFIEVSRAIAYMGGGLYQGELCAYQINGNGIEEIFTVNLTEENMKNYRFKLWLHDFIIKYPDDKTYTYRLDWLRAKWANAFYPIQGLDPRMLTEFMRNKPVCIIESHTHKMDKLRMIQRASEQKWEGIVVKDMQAMYTPGKSKASLKFKRMYTEDKETHDCIVIGVTKTKGEKKNPPNPFGALILAQYIPNTGLTFVCKCSGISDADRTELIKTLRQAASENNGASTHFTRDKKDYPVKLPISNTEIQELFYRPSVVVEISCMNTTKDLKYRAPKFLRIRDDKHFSECMIEDEESAYN